MPFGSPVNPVPGTVITAAYAVTNILDPIRWLRLMTGNSDPPGSAYALVSTSTSAVAWSKIGPDALAPGTATGNLGYTPVNKAGDTGIGNLSSLGQIAAEALVSGGNVSAGGSVSAGGTVSAAAFSGGSPVLGHLNVAGVTIGANGLGSSGSINTTGGAAINSSGAVSAASYAGGSTTAGTPSVLGLTVGANGISSTGTIAGSTITATANIGAAGTVSAGIFSGGTTSSGGVSAAGFAAGVGGFAGGPHSGTTGSFTGNFGTTATMSAGAFNGGSTTLGGVSALGFAAGTAGFVGGPHSGTTASFTGNIGTTGGTVSGAVFSGGTTANGGLSLLGLAVGASGIASSGPILAGTQEVYHPGNPPPGSSGGIPSGLIASIATGALPTGWSFYTPANGRVIVAAGTASVTNPQTFTVGTNYGGDWAHAHASNTFAVSVSGTVSVAGSATGGPGDITAGPSATATRLDGGNAVASDAHTHSLNGVSLAVNASGSNTLGGSATGSTTGAIWIPPSHALNAIRKD